MKKLEGTCGASLGWALGGWGRAEGHKKKEKRKEKGKKPILNTVLPFWGGGERVGGIQGTCEGERRGEG